MIIKHTLMLFCITLTLTFFLVSCATSSEGSNETDNRESNLDYQSNFEFQESNSNYQSNSNFQSNSNYQSNSNFQSNLDYQSNFEFQSNSNFQSNINYQIWVNNLTVADVASESCAAVEAELNCFISVWDTTKFRAGASAGSTIVLPLVNNGKYDFYVNWGDDSGVEQITSASDATHTYKTEGEKTIHIAGDIKGWRFYAAHKKYGDAVKLLDITQWGSLSLGNTAGYQFCYTQNFNPTATDGPDLSETTDLGYAFIGSTSFNQDISGWKVSKVSNMEHMFYGASNFNNGEEKLDWGDKTSNVTNMTFMFSQANTFNQDISDWDVSGATNMKAMFDGAGIFNQDLSGWDVSQVTTMNSIFEDAKRFNNNGKELDWGSKTSKVTNMADMFYAAYDFNQNIKNWNVSQVTSMENMFFGATNFNNDGEALAWGDNTSSVTNMANMFGGATIFNQDISGWDVSEVTDMNFMFYGAENFKQNIKEWEVGKVKSSKNFQDFAKLSGLRDAYNPFISKVDE